MIQPIKSVQDFKNMTTKQKIATAVGATAATGAAVAGTVVAAKKGKLDFSKLGSLTNKIASYLRIAKGHTQAFFLNGAAKVLNGLAKIFKQ